MANIVVNVLGDLLSKEEKHYRAKGVEGIEEELGIDRSRISHNIPGCPHISHLGTIDLYYILISQT